MQQITNTTANNAPRVRYKRAQQTEEQFLGALMNELTIRGRFEMSEAIRATSRGDIRDANIRFINAALEYRERSGGDAYDAADYLCAGFRMKDHDCLKTICKHLNGMGRSDLVLLLAMDFGVEHLALSMLVSREGGALYVAEMLNSRWPVSETVDA